MEKDKKKELKVKKKIMDSLKESAKTVGKGISRFSRNMERGNNMRNMTVPNQQVPNGDNFDRMVARMRTVPLTSNTVPLTRLPSFEPSDSGEAENIARLIP